jgi:hypothetical protein
MDIALTNNVNVLRDMKDDFVIRNSAQISVRDTESVRAISHVNVIPTGVDYNAMKLNVLMIALITECALVTSASAKMVRNILLCINLISIITL